MSDAPSAMVLHKPAPIENQPLRLSPFDIPAPEAGQVRVRVEACGVCLTDLHTVEGELTLPQLPIIPGHQVVGRIDELGDGVDGWAVGDRLGLAWLGYTCQQCSFCRQEYENLCPDARFTGLHFNGGYAQYVLADPRFAYRLPENVSAVSLAPLLCAGIIGYRALKLSGIQPHQCLGLYGFGASAHIAIQIANHWKCRVFVFSRSQQHRKLAEKLGADWTGQITDPVPQPLHGSILFAPAGPLVPVALEHLEKAGTLVLAGIHMSQIPPLDYRRHLYYEKTLRSVTANTRQDGRELLRLAGQINLKTNTTEFPLDQANLALHQLKQGKINAAAVLTVPN